MINNYKNNKGFTLLEIAVSIFIVSLGILGVLGLINYSMQAEIVSRNELIASQLAQEGLELVRNIRDNNWLNKINWSSDLTDGDDTFIIYYNKVPDFSVDNIGDAEAKLFLDLDGFYFHGGATTTNFSRLITIKDKDIIHTPPEYFTVESNVLWHDQKGAHEYKAETKLYNWR